MLSRITARCLAILVLVPFTAPFRTVDLAVLLHGTHAPAPVKTPASSTVTHEINVASMPTISRVGRVRLLPLSGVSVSAVVIVGAAAGAARTPSPGVGMRAGAALSTILRL